MAIITISRQFGSGGDEIAFELSKALSYPLFDKRLVLQAAEEAGLEDLDIVDFSEDNYKVRGFLDRLFSGTPILPYPGIWADDLSVMYGLEETQLREEDSLKLEQRAIEFAYQAGDMVIVGRGGQVLLKDRPNVLHVRIVAPLEKRMDQVRAQLKLYGPGTQVETERQLDARALGLIHERDAASADYIKRFYHVDRADPLFYHLLINTGKVTIERAVQIIQQMVELQKV